MLSHYNSTWLHKKSFMKAHFISPLKRLVHFQGIISLSKQVWFNFQSLLKRCSSHSPIPSVNWKKTKDLHLNNFLVLHINKDANSSFDLTACNKFIDKLITPESTLLFVIRFCIVFLFLIRGYTSFPCILNKCNKQHHSNSSFTRKIEELT